LLVDLRDEQVHRLDHVVVAAHGQRLPVGQSRMETRRDLVHLHVDYLGNGVAVEAGDALQMRSSPLGNNPRGRSASPGPRPLPRLRGRAGVGAYQASTAT